MESKSETRHRANQVENLARKSLESAKLYAQRMREEKGEWREVYAAEFRQAMWRYRAALRLAKDIRKRL